MRQLVITVRAHAPDKADRPAVLCNRLRDDGLFSPARMVFENVRFRADMRSMIYYCEA